MKKLIYLLLAVLLFVSCEKESSENKSHGTLKITTKKTTTTLNYSTEDVAGTFQLSDFIKSSNDQKGIFGIGGRTPDNWGIFLFVSVPALEVGKTYVDDVLHGDDLYVYEGNRNYYDIGGEDAGVENVKMTCFFSELNYPGRIKGVIKGINKDNGEEFIKFEFDFVYVEEGYF